MAAPTVGHPRKQLADLLASALPAAWAVIGSSRNVDPKNRTSVRVKQLAVEKATGVGSRTRSVRFVVTLVSRYVESEKAEDDLDSTLPILLDALEQWSGIRWDTAERVTVDNETRHGYDVTVYLYTQKENL